MAQKTRSDLYTQSNNTFQNTPAGNITPPNHRQYNDDAVESAANLLDENTFSGNNTFDGSDTIVNNNFYGNGFSQFAGSLLSCNTQLKQQLVSTPITAGPIIDLTFVNGNFITISGGGTINSFQGNQGSLFYATFDQQTDLVDSGTSIIPSESKRFFANDTIIFEFVSGSEIRIIGVRRVNQPSNSQYNGQNYFTINTPQDALDILGMGLLDVGAVYRVVGAYVSSVLDGVVASWDVYLTAQTQDTFNKNCIITNADGSGASYDALFIGPDFSDGNIKISKQSDKYAPITFAKAGITSGLNSTFEYASKALIADDETGFEGYAYFDLSENVQTNNLLNLSGAGTFKFGTIKNTINGNVFFEHFGSSLSGPYGTLFSLGAPNAGQITASMAAAGLTGITINSYVCNYQIVNLGVVVHFKADVTGPFNLIPDGHSLRFWMPKPFPSDASDYGYGSLRNLTDANHGDMGVIVEPILSNGFFLVAAKHSSAINTAKNCIVSGCYIYANGGL